MRTRSPSPPLSSDPLRSAGAVSALFFLTALALSPALAAPTASSTPTAPTAPSPAAAPETVRPTASESTAEGSAASAAARRYSEEELAAAKEEARLKALRYADRGSRHLWIAFSMIWLVIFLFIFRTWRQSDALEGELSAVKARLRALEGDERGGEG